MPESTDASPRCRLVVLISGSGSNLQALLDGADSASGSYHIVATISNKADAYGLERARQAGIDRAVIDHRQYASRQAFDRVLADTIDGYRPDLVHIDADFQVHGSWVAGHYQDHGVQSSDR